MKKWTIPRLVLSGFAAAGLMLALLAGIAWYSVMRSLEMAAWKDHGNAVLLATEKITSSLALATAAHQRYLLAGEHGALWQRDAALEALQTTLAQLAVLTDGDLEQQAHLQHIRRIVPSRIEAFDSSEALRAKRGMRSSANWSGAGDPAAGDPVAGQLQDILAQMVGHERRQLRRHQAEAQAKLRWAQTSGALLLVVLAMLLGGIYLLIARNIRQDATRLALEKNEALLRQILELLPVGVLVAERDGSLGLVNPAAHAIWGSMLAQGTDLPLAYHAWCPRTGKKLDPGQTGAVRALCNGEPTLNQELEILCADGSRKIIRSSAMPLCDAEREIVGAIMVNMDVTDLKRTERALQAAHDALEARVAMRTRELVVANAQLTAQIDERRRVEEALRQTQNILTIAQRVAHVGSWEIDLVTQETQWSDEFYRICGLAPGAIAPSIAAAFRMIHPEDHQAVSAAVQRAAAQNGEYKISLRLVRPDGAIRHVLLQGEPVHRGLAPPERLIGSMLDITEQKETEEMLRQLAVHQQTIKEEERKRIAREIHDEMGQNLMALRIDVSMLHARTAQVHPRLHAKVATVLDNIDHTIKSVRNVINNLRPVVLDLGLYASFQWQLNEFQRRSGICCELSAGADELDCGLNEEQTTALFRILQESLTNVARHANARNVGISLHRADNRLFMRICDDGVGIYPQDRRKPKSFGLLGMKERITAIGGTLQVESMVGQGTVLTLSIPLASDFEEAPRLQA